MTGFATATTSDSTPWLGTLAAGESLRRRIWPRSIVFWMAALYMALFIIRPWEKLFPALGAIHFERIYAGLMVVATALSAGGFRLRPHRQTAAVLLFTLALVISALFAFDTTAAWEALYRYLTLVVFYFVIVSVVRTPYQLCVMLTCYLITMGVYLAKAQWEYFVHGAFWYTMGVKRLVGASIEESFGGPNDLAASIVLSLPVLWFLFRSRRELTALWPRVWRRAFHVGLAGYAVLAVSSVMLTNSRSGMLGVALFVLIAGLRGRSWSRKLAYAAGSFALVALLWLALPADKQERLRTVWDPEGGDRTAKASAEGRLAGFLAGIEMFRREPLTGIGVGNFIPYRLAYLDGVKLESHNLIGQLLGETGALGCLAFLTMVGVTLWNCRLIARLARQFPLPRAAVLDRLAGAGAETILLLLFLGMFGHNLLRFNWLWWSAFSVIAWESLRRTCRQELARRELLVESTDSQTAAAG